MSTTAIVWTIVIVLVVLALAFLAFRMMSGKRQQDRHRAKADDIRQEAAVQERTVRKSEAEAAEKEAMARQAQAEADRKAAAAEKLSVEAQEGSEHASEYRADHSERLAAADEIDPDVPNDPVDGDGFDGADHPEASGPNDSAGLGTDRDYDGRTDRDSTDRDSVDTVDTRTDRRTVEGT